MCVVHPVFITRHCSQCVIVVGETMVRPQGRGLVIGLEKRKLAKRKKKKTYQQFTSKRVRVSWHMVQVKAVHACVRSLSHGDLAGPPHQENLCCLGILRTETSLDTA